MNVLIVCTYFPPDTAIAAIRPFMFAKYLSKRGHKVTVLTSGYINQICDPLVNINGFGFDIVYACQQPQFIKSVGTSRISWIPFNIRRHISKVYHYIASPFHYYKTIAEVDRRVSFYTDCIIEQLAGKSYDVVFSTFGETENIFVGEFASKYFCAKWIMDFRDPIIHENQPFYVYRRNLSIQEYAINKANVVTTVSEDLAKKLKGTDGKDVFVIHNGYDEEDLSIPVTTSIQTTNNFVICYTGQIYKKQLPALRDLFEAINVLIQNGVVDLEYIRFEYAGPHSQVVRSLMSEFGLEAQLLDHGYVTKKIAAEIQMRADLFLVLSWNTNQEQGVITGKFYEGIKYRKNILALVSGNLCNCELQRLNKIHNYGFCYEKVEKNVQFEELISFLNSLVLGKRKGAYSLKRDIMHPDYYSYRNLTKLLEKLF